MLHNLVLLICHFIVKVIMNFDNIFMIKFFQDVVFLFLGHLLLNIIKPSNLHCERTYFFIILLFMTHINGWMEAFTNFFTAIIKLIELTGLFLVIVNLNQILRAHANKFHFFVYSWTHQVFAWTIFLITLRRNIFSF